MAKRAVLIGCNYPGTEDELEGCVNDVQRVRRCLVELFGFDERDIEVLIDTDGSYTQPTGANICQSVERLVRRAKPGDSLFIHYSGHGLRLPTADGEEDDTGYDECIVPCDMNLITDNDFRDFVCQVPDGCRLTIVADSCHSGGLIDSSEEQIGESYYNHKHHETGPAENGDSRRDGGLESKGVRVKKRSLRLSNLIEILKQKTGREDIVPGNVRSALFDIFGDDASPSIKKSMNKLQHGARDRDIGCVVGGLMSVAWSVMKNIFQQKSEEIPELEYEAYSTRAANRRSGGPENGILISGCQTDQKSVDGHSTESGNVTYGALSDAIQVILAKNHGKISNRRLVQSARERLAKQGLRQRPGLYCSDSYADAPFICS
ncbi:metacaspase-4-like [Iris pallida]|uniref:Metacaspase-4-like n=1 Tax=Iris pallida TaxID=29817 RepID=A0AAX6IK26_IRIPA|nr:metacaspase-4-like [Iris pallida]